jgi:hypothetical protein
MLVPVNERAALTESINDPSRVLLLHREEGYLTSIPISADRANFSLSTLLNRTVSFDVVVFAKSNPGKKVNSNAMIDVHLMVDNTKTFNYHPSVHSVPSRLVCQHPLVPLGFNFLYYQDSGNAKQSVKVLRLACTVDIKAVTASINPVPVYFKADLFPFALPTDHPMLTYKADVRSRFTNPYAFSVPFDHLAPFLNVGDLVILKIIPECLHLACVTSHTHDPFEVSMLLQLVFKPDSLDKEVYTSNEGAKSVRDGPVTETEPGESDVRNAALQHKPLSFIVGEVTEVYISVKNYVLQDTLFLVLFQEECTPMHPSRSPWLMRFSSVRSSGNT